MSNHRRAKQQSLVGTVSVSGHYFLKSHRLEGLKSWSLGTFIKSRKMGMWFAVFFFFFFFFFGTISASKDAESNLNARKFQSKIAKCSEIYENVHCPKFNG